MDQRLSINIAIIGAVSAGKSTLLNALFVEQFSDMKIKRTTMVPQVYHEIIIDKKDSHSEYIRENNRKINDELIKKTEQGQVLSEVKEIEYFVPQVFDLVSLKKDVFLSIYDIPGLNDSRTKQIYFDYITNNFYKFDIIIFVIDINSAINTSDELDILNLIANNIKKNKTDYNVDTKLVVLTNKCDEMFLEKGKLVLEPEFNDMFKQAVHTIETKMKEIVGDNKSNIIIPISCEDAYIYRMFKRNPNVNLDIKYLNKFGTYEYGKTRWNRLDEQTKKQKIKILFDKFNFDERMELTGFVQLKNYLSKILNETGQYNYLINHLKYELSQIKDYNKIDVSNEITQFYKIREKIDNLEYIFPTIKNNDMERFCIEQFNKFNELHKSTIIVPALTASHVTESNFEINKMLKRGLETIKKLFNGVWKNYQQTYSDVVLSVNDYYLAKNKNETDYEKRFALINELKTNEYDQWKQELVKTFNSTGNVTHILSIYNIPATEFVKKLQHYYKIFDLSVNEKISITYDIMLSLYKYHQQVNGQSDYMWSACLFWSDVFIESTCSMKNKLELFKRGFVFVNLFSSSFDLKIIELPLEQYFYSLLKKQFVDEIFTVANNEIHNVDDHVLVTELNKLPKKANISLSDELDRELE